MGALKQIRRRAEALLLQAADKVSEKTGYVARRAALGRGDGVRSFTLDLTGYRQVDSYSCGAVAGFMALKLLKPKATFEKFYDLVQPHPTRGTSPTKLIASLRKAGCSVSAQRDLSFESIATAVEEDGCPVITTVVRAGAESDDDDHWVVIYGVGRSPRTVFIAGDGVPWDDNEWTWRRFQRRWSTPGEGWVIS